MNLPKNLLFSRPLFLSQVSSRYVAGADGDRRRSAFLPGLATLFCPRGRFASQVNHFLQTCDTLVPDLRRFCLSPATLWSRTCDNFVCHLRHFGPGPATFLFVTCDTLVPDLRRFGRFLEFKCIYWDSKFGLEPKVL